MKNTTSRAGLYLGIAALAVSLVFPIQANERKPSISLEQAIVLAKTYVNEHKIDISKHYLDSVKLELNPRGDRGPFWLIIWELNAFTKGGQVIVHVYMDKQVEVLRGE